jgi:ADP-heptose:LPS heptosyltransferase
LKKNEVLRKKILIIRFSSIGDIVLTTPVVRCLAAQMPDAEIHYLSKTSYKILLESNPAIHKIHVLDKHPIWKAAELKAENFDLVIDLHNNLRTAMIKAILGITSYSFPKLNVEKFMRVYFGSNQLPDIHIVDRYLFTIENLGVQNDGLGLDYFIPKKDEVNTLTQFQLYPQQYYTWAVGAQHFTKRLPNEQIIKVILKLDLPVVLLGGKEDVSNANIIVEAIGNKCIHACGALNLNQSASVVQQSKRLFTNDTGLMHIGAALKVPITSFWGNTLPEFGMTPYYGKADLSYKTVEKKDLSCRPCSKIGFNKCPKGHFKCMSNLEIPNSDLVQD